MNQAPIDHLLQATSVRPEAFGASSRSRDGAAGFDNHFRQANEASKSSSKPATESASTAPPAASSAAAAPSATSINSDSRQQSSGSSSSDVASASTATNDESLKNHAVDEASEAPEEDSDENAEVATLLAVAFAEESVVKEVATDEPLESSDVPKVKEAQDKANTKDGQQSPRDAAANSPVTSEDLGGEKDSDTASEVDTKKAADAKQSETSDAAAESNSPAAAETTAADSDPKARRTKSTDDQHAPADAAANPEIEGHKANEISTATAPAASKSSNAGERSESSDKREKRISVRGSTATADAAAASVERPATGPRAAETATAPVVANVQTMQAADAASTTAASTAAKSATSGEGKPGILSSLNRLDRGAASGPRGALRPGQTESPSHVDPARFISRVSRAVQTAHERGGPLQLRLSPPELGAMRIELSVKQGALTATVETDSQAAKQVLLDNLPALRDRLAEQSIKVERFDVDVRRDPSGSQQQNDAPQDRNQSQRQNLTTANTTTSRRTTAAALDEPSPIRRTISNTSINVVA